VPSVFRVIVALGGFHALGLKLARRASAQALGSVCVARRSMWAGLRAPVAGDLLFSPLDRTHAAVVSLWASAHHSVGKTLLHFVELTLDHSGLFSVPHLLEYRKSEIERIAEQSKEGVGVTLR
jgi:hypothetical protein